MIKLSISNLILLLTLHGYFCRHRCNVFNMRFYEAWICDFNCISMSWHAKILYPWSVQIHTLYQITERIEEKTSIFVPDESPSTTPLFFIEYFFSLFLSVSQNWLECLIIFQIKKWTKILFKSNTHNHFYCMSSFIYIICFSLINFCSKLFNFCWNLIHTITHFIFLTYSLW